MTTARSAAPAAPPNPTGDTEPDGTQDATGQGLPDGQVSRRQWVRGAAIAGTAVAAGVGLAACSTAAPKQAGPAPRPTGGAGPGSTAPGKSGATSSAVPQTEPPVASGTAPVGSGESFPALTVGKASTVPVGGGVVFPSHGVVVTQPTRGDFKCFSSSCTHLGCMVSKVSAGLILCPCHGAKFSIVDGSVKAGPATRALPAQDFNIKNGVIDLD